MDESEMRKDEPTMARCKPYQGRLIRRAAQLLLAGPFIINGCFDSDIFKRFREAYAPSAAEGFSQAITDPENAEDGLRLAGAALLDGLEAVIQPRTPSSADQ